MSNEPPLRTPDGKYLVVRGRLWRASNPGLPEAVSSELTSALMAARRDVRSALASNDPVKLRRARADVNKAKISLGERGAPWWTDGAPDFNRYLAKNTPYADWYFATQVS